MTTPTHEEISLQAWQLWQNRECPTGCDSEIWLEAERILRDDPAADIFAGSATAETAAESEDHFSPAQTEQESMQEIMQKKFARAPQVPNHPAPKSKPAETGKPLWSRPHSS